MSEAWNGSPPPRELWRRWKMAGLVDHGEAVTDETLDEMTLAAYAEGTLEEAARRAVDAVLARHPEIAEDVVLARGGASAAPIDEAALAAIIVRAAALVPASQGRVIRFPAAPFRPVRQAANWAALAASVAIAGYLGFALGNDAYANLAAIDQVSAIGLADELFDPPSGLFGGLPDTSGT